MASESSISSSIEMTEKSKVGFVRSILERKGSIAVDVDDAMIRRFLRARDLDVDKASDLLLKYLRWRKDIMPKGCISETDVQYELSQEKVYIQGFNKIGQPIVVIFGAKHIPAKGKGRLEEFKCFVAYCLDKFCANMPRGCEKFLGIVDLKGWGYSHCDIRGYLELLSILQDCYPERLGKLLFVHSPYLFMTAWKIIYPFIDNNTRKKIAFVDNKNLKKTLLHDIDENQLPEIYGGKLSLVPIQDS